MTTRGTQIAFVFAVLITFLLPKRTECSFPGATCGHAGRGRTTCTYADVEPLGFYLLESVFERNIGFAYSREEECR